MLLGSSMDGVGDGESSQEEKLSVGLARPALPCPRSGSGLLVEVACRAPRRARRGRIVLDSAEKSKNSSHDSVTGFLSDMEVDDSAVDIFGLLIMWCLFVFVDLK